MDYFYVPRQRIARDSVEITGEEFNHLVHVMRKKEGDMIRVVDGEGSAYDVEMISLRKRTAVGKVVSLYKRLHESDVDVHLAVGILENPSKFDFLVEKVTEVGVRRIIPLASERTIPKHAQVERWRKLALAAMKQSGRSYLPAVEGLQSLASVLESCSMYNFACVCHEHDVDAARLSLLL